MTKMKFKLFRSTFLLPFGMLISLTTGELEFYQDAVPKIPEEIKEFTLEEIARYFDVPSSHQRRIHLPSHMNQRSQRDHQLDYLLHKRNFETRDVPNLIELLQKQNLNPLDYIQQIHRNDLSSARYIASLDRYPEYDSFKKSIFEKDMEERLLNYPGKLVKMHEGGNIREPNELRERYDNMPEFTYAFGEPDLNDEYPFAVRPNDPRYYQETPFNHFADNNDDDDNDDEEEDNEREHQNLPMIQEPKRMLSSSNNPLILSVEKANNDDIYFIAIVAGCSAAAMFAVVLISLTWCRLQRVAKAAADIEYPAYGVTGPNKDVSPSGDQRLAQSAQMYHFQHQKQQIIAMENRVSAANRDPGSVSEADSDEENGDYTVYECPGLAPTGEMEVKNPLFHDDPTPATPATPAQSKREEDQ